MPKTQMRMGLLVIHQTNVRLVIDDRVDDFSGTARINLQPDSTMCFSEFTQGMVDQITNEPFPNPK